MEGEEGTGGPGASSGAGTESLEEFAAHPADGMPKALQGHHYRRSPKRACAHRIALTNWLMPPSQRNHLSEVVFIAHESRVLLVIDLDLLANGLDDSRNARRFIQPVLSAPDVTLASEHRARIVPHRPNLRRIWLMIGMIDFIRGASTA
jgi:hypothetical protein